ncbi:MAG TPA: cupin domain-containing protein [Methylomirabilota bacterium]|jgi:mannose-6-phosphate isomerase-like protein (cupin superfamily)
MQMLRKVDKPWGYELLWAQTPRYAAKILYIKKGEQLSLQYHERKEETMLLHSGRMLLILEDEHGVLRDIYVAPGEAYHIPVGRRHRMVALDEDCKVFEVSTNDLDDVVRIDDLYGRVAVASAGAGVRDTR